MGRIGKLYEYIWTSPYLESKRLPPYVFEIVAQDLDDAKRKINYRLGTNAAPGDHAFNFEVLDVQRLKTPKDSLYVAAGIIAEESIEWDA